MSKDIVRIPTTIKPDMREHRIEVLFWGVRKLGKLNLLRINRPKISIYCQNDILDSDIIPNARVDPNFSNQVKMMTVVNRMNVRN